MLRCRLADNLRRRARGTARTRNRRALTRVQFLRRAELAAEPSRSRDVPRRDQLPRRARLVLGAAGRDQVSGDIICDRLSLRAKGALRHRNASILSACRSFDVRQCFTARRNAWFSLIRAELLRDLLWRFEIAGISVDFVISAVSDNLVFRDVDIVNLLISSPEITRVILLWRQPAGTACSRVLAAVVKTDRLRLGRRRTLPRRKHSCKRRELLRLNRSGACSVRRPPVRRGDLRLHRSNLGIGRRKVPFGRLRLAALAMPRLKRLPPFQ